MTFSLVDPANATRGASAVKQVDRSGAAVDLLQKLEV
jgi:hypothetical protein